MKNNRERLTKSQVEEVLRSYFGCSLREMCVTVSILCIHAHVVYNDFKTQLTAQRELMDRLPGVYLYLERGYTDGATLDALYGADLDEQEIYIKDQSGSLIRTTIHEYLFEYLDNKEMCQTSHQTNSSQILNQFAC